MFECLIKYMSVIQVPFQVPLEVNIVLIGFHNDGGYRYTVDAHKLEEFLRISFPSHRPSCLETSEPLDIEHHIVYNVFPVCFSKLLFSLISPNMIGAVGCFNLLLWVFYVIIMILVCYMPYNLSITIFNSLVLVILV